ncbi:receptor-transporting protein 3-like [Phaenicophaeus curvirostris]|uniref:receptor-transporting protein 3-like n=1 Tax=Phaenicophaeus curvirostris TaxID=33595 RepID=UPI0037F09D8F
METWQDVFAKIAVMHLPEPWTLQEDDTLRADNLKPGWKKFVQRCAFGRFQCSQCSHEWYSAKVSILYHMHRYTGWGKVWMRVFRQACSRCPNPWLEEPKFIQETMERLLHNLVLKILKYYYSVSVQPSDLLEVVVDVPMAGPHDSTHCEGCQVGICRESRPAPASDARKPVMDVDEVRTNDTHHIQQTHHKKPASDAWKPAVDVDEVRTNDTHHTHQTHHMKPVLDAWEPVMDVEKVRTNDTHHTQQTNHKKPASDAWKPVVDVDEVRTNDTHHTHQTHHMRPVLDTWVPVMDVKKVRTNDTHRTHQTHHKRPASDAWKPLVDADKVRTNYTYHTVQTHHTDQTHHTSPAATSTCCPLLFSGCCPSEGCCQLLECCCCCPLECCCRLLECCCSSEYCCCTGSPMVCILVVLIYILYYFTN